MQKEIHIRKETYMREKNLNMSRETCIRETRPTYEEKEIPACRKRHTNSEIDLYVCQKRPISEKRDLYIGKIYK